MFDRALKQLGIEHIAAYSPQARGRSERVFATLQDRLPKELALAGITTMAEANRRQVYIPEHNARFAIAAQQEGSAFVIDALRGILCIQEERKVGNNNTVNGRRLKPTTAAEPVETALREGDGAGARNSRW